MANRSPAKKRSPYKTNRVTFNEGGKRIDKAILNGAIYFFKSPPAPLFQRGENQDDLFPRGDIQKRNRGEC
jgi:hypothetical protein